MALDLIALRTERQYFRLQLRVRGGIEVQQMAKERRPPCQNRSSRNGTTTRSSRRLNYVYLHEELKDGPVGSSYTHRALRQQDTCISPSVRWEREQKTGWNHVFALGW